MEDKSAPTGTSRHPAIGLGSCGAAPAGRAHQCRFGRHPDERCPARSWYCVFQEGLAFEGDCHGDRSTVGTVKSRLYHSEHADVAVGGSLGMTRDTHDEARS